ncbi:MAG TPA: hypothetical protein VJ327_03485, partial [Patescibacteria group bacterium]|nr:hypothetical protein [Patescibacteria group bacterium]
NPFLRRPDQILEAKEWYTMGCGSCGNHVLKRDKTAYHCSMSVQEYPGLDNKTCLLWRRKTKTTGALEYGK